MDPVNLAKVIIQMNFAGTHATSLTATHLFYHILSYPESRVLSDQLRKEMMIYTSSGRDQWTWHSLDKLKLLDSVVRESIRCAPLDNAVLTRVLLKDVTTPDGLWLAAGTKVCIPGLIGNLDDVRYENGYRFDPYRFAKGDETFEASTAVSRNFTSFGYGPHVSASLPPSRYRNLMQCSPAPDGGSLQQR